ncbi:glycoside hydrolase family 73 protein [Lactobacillus sp.]|uniref:glycoside hydrolase family 73 protein n=1 Tax=Lactobacillus sp. TaxID=1591 RepID=UPI001986ECFE|nr:glycoside hydrolase family 73 protein [Lactobacillus sp.]MBD5430649.1 glycoside hydrolase family 73 protein [Lactobacillus sp.]
MDKRTITGIATAALITTAGISITNNVKSLNITGSGGEVKAATSQNAQQFIDKVAPAATEASSKYGTYTSVMIAQAAVESGWGQSSLAKEPNNNLFGVKGDYNGQSVAVKTGEYGSNGYYTTTANFRKYPSYTESCNDNGALLREQMGSYYSGAWVENAKNYQDATQNGLQGKYATAPNYASTLNSVIKANHLDQYDPKTTTVNETKTVVKTTPITNAPVDNDVTKQVGTARVGQQVSVTKRITYSNGVSHSYIGTGWVNDTAFSNTSAIKTSSTATASKSATTTSTKKTTTTASKKNYTYIKTNEIVKVISAPEGGAPVLKSPKGKPTGQKLALNTSWRVSGYAIVDGTRYNRVGSKQWLSTIYTDSKLATEAKKKTSSQAPTVEKTVSNKKEETKKITTKATSNTVKAATTSYEKVVGKFKVTVSNIDVWNSPNEKITGQWLPANSTWKITGKKTSNGKTWYRISKNKWIQSAGIKVEKLEAAPVSQAPTTTTKTTTKKEKKTTKKVDYTVQKSSGVVTVNNQPNAGIVVWSQPGKNPTTKYLKTGTSWKFFKIAIWNGEKWYNLGGNQWVPAKYVMVR